MDAPNAPATTPDIAPKRRRNAAATRQAILESAREAFTRYGYDGVGLREIAQNAGVTAMLVNLGIGLLVGAVVLAVVTLIQRLRKPAGTTI